MITSVSSSSTFMTQIDLLYFSAKLQKVHLSTVALFYEIGITPVGYR